jgi:hypothetical protein
MAAIISPIGPLIVVFTPITATHGLVFARGIPYDERYRERIERLCIKEEHRFLRPLLTPESVAKMEKMRTFNSDAYRWHWASSFWQRWRQSVRHQKARKQREQRLRDNEAEQDAAANGSDGVVPFMLILVSTLKPSATCVLLSHG